MSGIQELLGQIARMRWSDYLDIILVAFLIYKRISPFIKGTHRTIAKKA